MYDLLKTWFQGWTVIAIAHKLQWVLDFDKVAVLDRGRLVEYADPAELLQSDSRFNKLFELSATTKVAAKRESAADVPGQ